MEKELVNSALKNKDLYFIKNNFHLLNGLNGFVFVMETTRNLKLIEAEIELMEKARKPSKEYEEGFLKEYTELQKNLADKDSEGNPIWDPHPTIQGRGNWRILKNEGKMEAGFLKLKEKYKADWEENEKKAQEFIDLLDQPAKISLYKISSSTIPQGIKMEQFQVIYYMVDFDEEVKEPKEKSNKKK